MRKKAKRTEQTADTAAAAREMMLQRHGIRQKRENAEDAREKMIDRKMKHK